MSNSRSAKDAASAGAQPVILGIPIDIPTAPDLVLDLLIARDGPLTGQSLCLAAAMVGVQESAVRVALTRLLADAKIRRQARGWYVLDSAGLALAAALDEWWAAARSGGRWNGEWIAVHDAKVPRSDKTVWRRHHLALSLRGFAAIEAGLHLRPANRPGGVDAERARLRAMGLGEVAWVCTVRDLDVSARAAVQAAWPVAELLAGHAALREALTAHQCAMPGMQRPQALRESLLLGRHAFTRLVRDPMLPDELMPTAPRDELAVAVRDYREHARVLWNDWLGSIGAEGRPGRLA